MKKTFSNKPVVVLGATGLLGSEIVASFARRGIRAYGTSRRASRTPQRLLLDTSREASVRGFPWSRFGVVIDCTGSVAYGNDAATAAGNAEGNVVGPLRVVARLRSDQRYFYCSTHAVLLNEKDQNSYSLSKRAAESVFRILPDGGPEVVVIRVPGLFSEKRTSGLFHLIKRSFQARSRLHLSVNTKMWHSMYAPRAADLVSAAVAAKRPGKVLTMAYHVPSTVPKIIAEAENIFGYRVPVRFGRVKTDRYRPRPDRLVEASDSDYKSDLRVYFSR